jgi:hypothetical protein
MCAALPAQVVGMGYKLIGGLTWSWIVRHQGVPGLYATCAMLYIPVIGAMLCLSDPQATGSKKSE